MVKNLPAVQETLSLGLEDSPEKGMATHSSILAEGFHGQRNVVDSQSMGLQRVGHD